MHVLHSNSQLHKSRMFNNQTEYFLILCFILPVVICLVFYIVIRFLLIKIPWFYIVYVLFGLIGTFMFSAMLNAEKIKEGTPFFWIVFFMGAASIFTIERMKKVQQQEILTANNPNVLDSEIILQKE